jgi:hypothetical protein
MVIFLGIEIAFIQLHSIVFGIVMMTIGSLSERICERCEAFCS